MILVTGATGNVGTPLVEELASGGAKLRALVRPGSDVARLRELGVETAEGSFDDEESLRRALDGVERVFLLTPPGVHDMLARQARVVDLAAAAGVEQIVKLSSIAADEPTEARIVRAHRRAEEHVERSGVAWTHLRPNWFMQNELAQAQTIAAAGTFYAPDVGRVSMVDARDVAAAAAAVLTGEGHAGRAYVLTGPEALSYADVAERFTRALGRPVSWSEVTLEEARESMLAGGLPDDLAGGFTEIMARYREGGVTAAVSPAVEELTGRRPRSFEQFAGDYADSFADSRQARVA